MAIHIITYRYRNNFKLFQKQLDQVEIDSLAQGPTDIEDMANGTVFETSLTQLSEKQDAGDSAISAPLGETEPIYMNLSASLKRHLAGDSSENGSENEVCSLNLIKNLFCFFR